MSLIFCNIITNIGTYTKKTLFYTSVGQKFNKDLIEMKPKLSKGLYSFSKVLGEVLFLMLESLMEFNSFPV